MKWETEYFPLGGGLNLTQPALSIKPGMCIDASNYVPAITGGYERIGGYERFDGRTKPSAASYYLLPANITGTVAVGNTITGATSGATGVVIALDTNLIVFTKLTGTFQAENLTVSGTVQAVSTAAATQDDEGDLSTHVSYRNLAADKYRSDITAVPGSGRVRGVWLYNGTVYAFRNNAGGTACDMYKSTASGWSQVTLGTEVQFTTGGATAPAEGATLTQGGVTATIRRVMVRSGTWGGNTAAGTFVITGVAGGNFAAGAATIGAINVTLSGVQTAITLSPNGRFEFVNYNFGGSSGALRMYGCDGVNKAFEFDGTYFCPIRTGMTTDAPSHIAAHKKHLFLSFSSSVQHSGVGDPYAWTALAGAAELAVGDTITNLLPLPGVAGSAALGVFAKNSLHVLYGSSSSDWDLQLYSNEAGALAYTAQSMDYVYALDNSGIRQVVPSQAYGNFDAFTLSTLVKPWLIARQGTAISSSIHRAKNQIRFYFSDGYGLAMTISGPNKAAIMPFDYGTNVRVVCSLEDTDGVEKVFFGDDNGYVYQAEIGTSFDGSNIEAWARLAFWHSKSPRVRKRYRRAAIEADIEEYTQIQVSHDCSYGSSDFPLSAIQTRAVIGNGGYWDDMEWDDFTWDAQAISQPEVELGGTGSNISILFRSDSDEYLGHTLQGVLMHYLPRRMER